MSKRPKTKVVFRVWPNGDVIALFPQESADNYGFLCLDFMHIGQHGAANTDTVVMETRLASPKEYRILARELRLRGYRLDIRKVCTAKDRRIRMAGAKI